MEKFSATLAALGPKLNAGNRSKVAASTNLFITSEDAHLCHIGVSSALPWLMSPPPVNTGPLSGVKEKMMTFPTSAQHPGHARVCYRALGTFVAPNSMLSSAEADRGDLLAKPSYLELPPRRQTSGHAVHFYATFLLYISPKPASAYLSVSWYRRNLSRLTAPQYRTTGLLLHRKTDTQPLSPTWLSYSQKSRFSSSPHGVSGLYGASPTRTACSAC